MATPTSRSHRGSVNITSDPRTLINIKYSNIPVNVPTLYPSSVKRKEDTLEYFGSPELMEPEPFITKGKAKYAEIKKSDQQDAVDLILKTTQHMDKTNQAKKKKGSMYISELWGTKHYKGIIKGSKLEEAYETKRKFEQEELSQRLERLEKAYEKRDFQIDDIDSKKVIEEFMTGGLNSPHLTVHRKSPLKGCRGRSLDIKAPVETTSGSEDSDTLPPIKAGNSSFSAVTADLLKKIQGTDSNKKSQFYQKSCNESIDSERSSKQSSCERESKTYRPVKSLFHMQSPKNRVIIKSSQKQVSIDMDDFSEKSPKPSIKVDSPDIDANRSTGPTSIMNIASFRIKTEPESGSLSSSRGVNSPKQTNFKPQFIKVKAASTRTLHKNLKTLY